MVAFMLESLVLRGVLVVGDELAVGLRLGTGTKANPRTRAIRNSTQAAPGCRKPDMQAVAEPDEGYSSSGVKPGAGRSRRLLASRILVGAARTSESLRLAARQSEKHLQEKRFPGEAFARLPVPPCWRKPAGRTPPVGIRENEGR
jgi:hypothetical protein